MAICPADPVVVAPRASRARTAALAVCASWLAVAITLGACSSDGTPADTTMPTATGTNTAEPTFTDLQKIFTRSCAFSSCHGGSSPQHNLTLESGKAYDAIVNKDSTVAGTKLIVPGDPDHSLIYQVLLNPVGDIERMPQASPALPDAEIASFKAWIAAGAKND